MIKRLCLLMLSAAIVLPIQAKALSLGEIVVLSKLSQPLEAEIAIPSIRPDEEANIVIALAPDTVFEQAGLERSAMLSRFIFTLKYKNDKTPYIQLRTREAVNELAISFFVEVTWKSGRIVRQYDILLEPPGMHSAVKHLKDGQSVALAADSDQVPALIEDRATMDQQFSSLARVVNPDAVISYGPVRPGESLSKIAQRVRPDPKMSLPQVMLALFRDNKDAFLNSNINELKAGSMLYLTSETSITAIKKSEAIVVVETHEQRWKSGEPMLASRSDEVLQQLVDSSSEKSLSGTVRRNQTVASNDETGESSSNTPRKLPDMPKKGSEKDYIDALTSELKIALDASDKLQKKNELLLSRLREIEGKVAMMQDRLSIPGDAKGAGAANDSIAHAAAEPAPETLALMKPDSPPTSSPPKSNLKQEVDGQFLLVLGPEYERDARPKEAANPTVNIAKSTGGGSDAPVFIAGGGESAAATVGGPAANAGMPTSILASTPKSIVRKEPEFIDQSAEGDQTLLTAIGGVSIVSLALIGFAMRYKREVVSDGFKRLRSQLKGRKEKIQWIK